MLIHLSCSSPPPSPDCFAMIHQLLIIIYQWHASGFTSPVCSVSSFSKTFFAYKIQFFCLELNVSQSLLKLFFFSQSLPWVLTGARVLFWGPGTHYFTIPSKNPLSAWITPSVSETLLCPLSPPLLPTSSRLPHVNTPPASVCWCLKWESFPLYFPRSQMACIPLSDSL